MARDSCGRLDLCARLMAFRYIEGSHSGDHLAEHFLRVLKELGITYKVCSMNHV